MEGEHHAHPPGADLREDISVASEGRAVGDGEGGVGGDRLRAEERTCGKTSTSWDALERTPSSGAKSHALLAHASGVAPPGQRG